MRLVLVLTVAFLSLFLLLFGCAGGNNNSASNLGSQGGAGNTAGVTNTGSTGATGATNAGTNTDSAGFTISDDYGNEVSTLPAAYAGEQYYSEIYPSLGTYPFACTLAQGSGLPGELAFSTGTCELTGRAPLLTSSKSTRAEYPFSFTIKDADGKTYGPFTLTLTVIPMPPQFTMINYPKDVQIGTPYSHDFCHPASDSPLNCGHTPPSDDPSSGVPPYTFTASRLPLGLTMRSDGHLFGTVPKGVLPGKQQIEVCAADSTGTEACYNATLTLLAPAEKWHGVLNGKYVVPDSNHVDAGSGYSYAYTADFEFPSSLYSVLNGDIVLYVNDEGNGTLSGSQTVLSQSKFGDESDLHYYGGSVSNVPFSVDANPPGKFILLNGVDSSNFLGGYVNILDSGKYFKYKLPYFSDEFVLYATSYSPTSMSGTWAIRYNGYKPPQGYGAVYMEKGTFTLNKVE